jgi:hypothetical protein
MFPYIPVIFWSAKRFPLTSVDTSNRNRIRNSYPFESAVLFWGCITYKGVGKLVPVEGNMNSEKYINVLDECLWPVLTKHFPTVDTSNRNRLRNSSLFESGIV